MEYFLYWFATYGVLMFLTTIVILASNEAYTWVTDNPSYVYPTILAISTAVSIFHNYIG